MMKGRLLPFLPHAVIAIAYAAWALGSTSEDRMFTWVAIGHGLAPLWAGLIAIPERPWRAYLVCVGTIIAGHVAAILSIICWLLIEQPREGHVIWALVIAWSIATLAYAGFGTAAFALVVQGRRARR